MRWMVAIAASMALHYGVFVAQPLLSRVGAPQGQIQSGGGGQRIAARVIEQTPVSVDSPPITAAMETREMAQPAKIEAGSVHAVATKPLNTWRPDADMRFYAIEEVDQPALPVLNWQFPSQTPASIQLRHLVVQVWIAENGDILNVELLSSEPQIAGEQKQNIERSLIQTSMTPATKDGRQVASQRTLEMALEF
ncbi:MAG: hypothetical protein B7X65_18120 [Polaromonas sp. 39-63-25]|nr:MAG: hypothetical protein B7Y60_05125 [Polaromonas sp. 35-63-35]OYZ17976.1 MAG: hypothetical protein B7Y28_17480 [Polaromonas sp. 16-63-31]OYZ79356.1 MAG: hypothetical protein B7Y09_07235 [Polaromonas sp. 24-63-21]OZA50498.1 MAG: hypothetical protein B7X88_09445 [Polaromonas sp. 17-63-33]OZA86247.1 MAG: hypothetical protein B7X65_18120 [Polaromonas sp. 39-63-25]